MTQQQIQERNEQIALMLGLTPTKGFGSKKNEYFKKIDGDKTIMYNKVLFHSDWNWLMEAVEFIDKLSNYFIQIEEKSCYVYDISKFDNSQTNAFIIKDGKTKKESIFIAVSDFAKLYNNKEL
jgi:hypothetical protein